MFTLIPDTFSCVGPKSYPHSVNIHLRLPTKYVCHIQLFRERLSEKNVHATIPKGNMGYDQYTVPDTVAVELSFVAFL